MVSELISVNFGYVNGYTIVLMNQKIVDSHKIRLFEVILVLAALEY